MDGFRYYFTPLTGVLFTFPSRYWFTIGRRVMFSLGGWSTQIPTGFLVPRGTRVPGRSLGFSPTGLSPSLVSLSRPSTTVGFLLRVARAPQPPETEALGFGLFRVRSPLLTESLLLSFPPGTEMVHFPGFASSSLCIQQVIARLDPGGVAPFGNPRIKACLRLPEAYRSLPRPSSLLCAKASTVHP